MTENSGCYTAELSVIKSSSKITPLYIALSSSHASRTFPIVEYSTIPAPNLHNRTRSIPDEVPHSRRSALILHAVEHQGCHGYPWVYYYYLLMYRSSEIPASYASTKPKLMAG
ncbi:Uncharacterized protein HZ326_29942 [Fusarium oxysporum f. sp. albedinis]|nr:Uncharacterized protein HZ326_29942 [Fusarium oxysporum f. sp. albedinis]